MEDQRIQLKIKIKSLAAEAQIIRKEERKLHGMDKWGLQNHRKTVVRNEARRSLIAYQHIRGRDPACHFHSDEAIRRGIDWPHVERMVRKYGSLESVNKLPFLQQAMNDGRSGDNDGRKERDTEDARSHAA